MKIYLISSYRDKRKPYLSNRWEVQVQKNNLLRNYTATSFPIEYVTQKNFWNVTVAVLWLYIYGSRWERILRQSQFWNHQIIRTEQGIKLLNCAPQSFKKYLPTGNNFDCYTVYIKTTNLVLIRDLSKFQEYSKYHMSSKED